MTSSPLHYGTMVADTLAGLAGGAAAVIVGQPMDTVKVKMQLYPDVYGGILSGLTKIVRQRGLRGLYAGMTPALVSNCAENAVLFATYGQCQKLVMVADGPPDTDFDYAMKNAAAGGMASIFTSFVLCPAELVKIRLQGSEVAKALRPSMRGMVKNIWKVDGFRGMYRGFWATLARESVGSSVFFGHYEWARRAVGRGLSELVADENGGGGSVGGVAADVVAAGTASAITGLTIYPADVIKSRVQRASARHGHGYRLVWDEIRATGLRSLYSGLKPALVKSVPVTSLLMFTVERAKPLFRKLLLPPPADPSSSPPSGPPSTS